MSLHTLYAVIDEDGVIADFFVSDCAVSFPDDVPASVDRQLSPNKRYSVLALPGTLTPVVEFVSAADAPETNHEPDDSAPPAPTAPASKSSKSAK